MLTFLELYQTLLGFVFFKLFTDINLVYPPKLDEMLDENGAGIGALLLEESGKGLVVVRGETDEEVEKKRVYAKDVRKQIKSIGLGGNDAAEAAAVAEDEAMGSAVVIGTTDDIELDVFPTTSTSDILQPEIVTSTTSLFSSYFFYLSREVTRPTLEFIIRSFGGQVGWDAVLGAGSPFLENDPRITHHIVDRPVVPGSAPRSHPGKRTYVQPQWVVDCLNRKTLLPADQYAPGAVLPPHLSPFVDEDAVRERGGYVPMEASNRVGDIDVMEEEEVSDEDDEDEEEDEEEEDEVEKKTNYAAISSKTQKKAPALLAAARDPTNDTLLHAAELEAEARGIAPAQFESELAVETKKAKKAAPKKIGGKKIDRSQEEQLASIMLTGKQKKLYNKMSFSRDRKLEEVSFLLSPFSF
jgi:pescadillo protein